MWTAASENWVCHDRTYRRNGDLHHRLDTMGVVP